jgi:hypothetical protein
VSSQRGALLDQGPHDLNHPRRIDSIPELAGCPWPTAEGGFAELAETVLDDSTRLIVRRTIVLDPAETLFKMWRYHAFVTYREGTAADLDVDHRRYAQVELVIRDLKDQALAHFPSGHYSANSAWTVIACLAHNLARWTDTLGLSDPTPRTTRTLRYRLFAVSGRLTHSARTWTLHLPARWPWELAFLTALERLRAMPALA